MADNPYAQYAANPYRPVYGSPRQPSPQTPDQAAGQALQNQHTQLENQTIPLQQQNTRTNIEQSQQNLVTNRAAAIDKARDGYRQDKRVLTFEAAIPIAMSALSAPENGAGDNMLINAAAKVGDPSTGVQQREGASWEASQPELDRAKANMLKQFGSDGYGNFTPEGRTKIREAIRQRAKFLAKQYDQARQDHAEYIKGLGLPDVNPGTILGPHAYAPYAKDEEAYITAHGGTPKVAGVPVGPGVAAPQTQAGFDLKQDPRNTELSPGQAKAYDAFWGANPNPSPEQLVGFVQSMGIPGAMPIEQAKAIIDAKKGGHGISHDVQIRPDISDVRGSGGPAEKLDAGIRGAADTASFGLADKIAAVGDTLTNGGSTLDQNLARQYAISDYDTQNHFPSRLIGQAAGGLAIPFGEATSVPQVALKSGAIGAGYGVGSSRSVGDVPTNALLGFAGGAAVGGAVSGVGRGINALRGGAKDVPPLVDPATGELNTPMDAMRPADRVQTMRDYGMQNISPGMAGGRTARVIEQGFNNVPGSAGVMEDFNSAASRDLRRSMQAEAQKFGTSKTLNEGGAELQRGANEWMTRADKLTSKVYDAISIPPAAKASLTNTVSALSDLTSKVGSNKALAEEVNDPTLRRYLDAMQKGGLDWSGLKEFRTFIGSKAGEFRFSQDARKDGYQALYGALSQDMRDTAASLGPRQLKEFERANSLYAAKENRIEGALVRILGPDSKAAPEKAAAAIRAMTMGGKAGGDLGRLAQVRASTIKSGAWDEVASTMIHLGGQPANSEGRAFDPRTFVQWYSDMSEPARRMLFKPELRRSLDGFVAMTQHLGRIKGLTNTSNTTPTMIGSGVVAASGVAAVTHPSALLAIFAGGVANYGMAKAWTNPKFLGLVTGYGRAVASGSPHAVKSQVGRLSKLAATNPELRAPIESLLKNIANDNAMVGVAASDSNSEKQ